MSAVPNFIYNLCTYCNVLHFKQNPSQGREGIGIKVYRPPADQLEKSMIQLGYTVKALFLLLIQNYDL